MTTNSKSPHPPVSGYLSTAYLGLLEDYLQAEGRSLAEVPGGSLLQQQAAQAVVMPVVAWRDVLIWCADALQQADLGLRLGQRFTPAHLGLLGYVLQSCVTLGAALERLQHYERLINGINRLHWQAVTDDASGLPCIDLLWGIEHGRPGQQVDSCAIAALLQVTRRITGHDGTLLLVDFVNPPPADRAPYDAFFTCPLRFDCKVTRVRLPAAWLDLPLPHPDPQLVSLLQHQVDTLLAQLPDEADIVQQVRRCMAQRLRQETTALSDIASDLHLSTRTLHRRLDEAGTSYRALWEDTRRHLAEEYLQDQRLTLCDVASLLGFSEQSAFTRAFRRWHGLGPKAWRLRQTRPGAG